jgi:hypothetical protein
MRGDFSAWNKDRSQNFRGTLHQQGRVLLDRDWNAQTEIYGEWQETAARDAFGAGVAAVPADAQDSFKVTKVEKKAGPPSFVEVSLSKGRIWADGLLAELTADVVRRADYFPLPIAPANPADALPNATIRDAVILETWLEELSPFQQPSLLIEPALGGVDTTERVQTAMRVRMYRMTDPKDTCDSIIDKLKDDFSTKGKLQVELKPTSTIDADCPVVESGGFTGFEHRLYRIEIADTDRANQSWFKWSHFNGGLVGTGDFDTVNRKVVIAGNKNAILYSGLNSFYLEALELDPNLGCWRVVYGAKALLAADGTITLPDPVVTPGDIFKGAIPPAPPNNQKRFFRLWNGIERVATFAAPAPAALKDLPDNLGIVLRFEPEAAGKYTPSDFWTFEARAGGLGNPPVLVGIPPAVPNGPVTPVPPQGIFYHRVPLAEVHWTANPVPAIDIEDCRRPFQPLTKLKTCCTYRVGDGVKSHGDFKKIQDAINALPKDGGEVCILPGLYEENIVIEPPHNKHIILKGCGKRTVIKFAPPGPNDPGPVDPVIHVMYGQDVTIESLAVEAHPDGKGILLEGVELDANGASAEKYLKDITLSGLYVHAAKNNAIKGFPAQGLTFCKSVVYIDDEQTRKPAVYLEGDDMLIERNEIRVLPDRLKPVIIEGPAPPAPPTIFDADTPATTNDPEILSQFPAQEAAGGLQIGGGSERVRIIDNLIVNGTGNGITLGRIDLKKGDEEIPGRDPFDPKDQDEDCCNPDDGFEDDGEENEDGYTAIAGPPLYDILIKFNRIFNMGRNGIGVASFFSMGDEPVIGKVKIDSFTAAGGLIFVSGLVIVENRIERCVNIPPRDIPAKMSYLMGYGGIALAVVETLVIRDNFILDNCRNCIDPVCGVFVLVGIGVDISRNEITEHLKQDYREILPAAVKHGPRGGIWLFIALGQMDIFTGSKYEKLSEIGFLRKSSGAHAARIHNNVVSVPLGRSLTMNVFGDASVLGNRFTSFGIVPVDILKLLLGLLTSKGAISMSAVLQLFSLLAANVLIFDLGSFVAFREYRTVQTSVNKTEAADAVAAGNLNTSPGVNRLAGTYSDLSAANRLMNVFTRAGMIHFSDNQCKLNPLNPSLSIAISSILIIGLADQGVHDNQTSCNIPKSLLITNAALLGGTLRATGNWLKETFLHVAYSAMTFGFLNATTDNESVHCLKVTGVQKLDRHNLILGAILVGAVGDIAEEEPRKKLLAACGRNSIGRILVLMYVAIMNEQDDPKTNAAVGSFVRTGGGG